MEVIGKQISKTQESYDSAMNKLSRGKGNLVKRTDDMQKLGLKTKKKIDAKLLEKADLDV